MATNNKSDSFETAARAAQLAMPGWHAASSVAEDSPSVPLEDSLPGHTLAQLQAKFLGTRVRSAMSDDKMMRRQGANEDTAHIVKMVRNRSDKPNSGPNEIVVLVSGAKVVAVQG